MTQSADTVRPYAWLEPLGVHDLDRTVEVSQRLAATYECTSPAYGAPGHPHCAACCYGTLIAASSMEEFETAQVLLAVPGLVREIQRLRAHNEGDEIGPLCMVLTEDNGSFCGWPLPCKVHGSRHRKWRGAEAELAAKRAAQTYGTV